MNEKLYEAVYNTPPPPCDYDCPDRPSCDRYCSTFKAYLEQENDNKCWPFPRGF